MDKKLGITLVGGLLVAILIVAALNSSDQSSDQSSDLTEASIATNESITGSSTTTSVSKKDTEEHSEESIDASLAIEESGISPEIQALVEDPTRIEDPNPNISHLGQRLQKMAERRQGLKFDAASVYQAMQKGDMWKVRSSVPTTTPMSETELSDGRPFVDVDPMRIESLMEGDTLDIYVPQESQVYTLAIEEVQIHDDINSVTWNGHVTNFEEDNYFTLTRGDSLMVGAITTPTEHYLFEVYDNVGWIEKAGKLFVNEGEPIQVDEHGEPIYVHEHEGE